MLGLLIRDKPILEHFCGAPFVLSSCGHCYSPGAYPKVYTYLGWCKMTPDGWLVGYLKIGFTTLYVFAMGNEDVRLSLEIYRGHRRQLADSHLANHNAGRHCLTMTNLQQGKAVVPLWISQEWSELSMFRDVDMLDPCRCCVKLTLMGSHGYVWKYGTGFHRISNGLSSFINWWSMFFLRQNQISIFFNIFFDTGFSLIFRLRMEKQINIAFVSHYIILYPLYQNHDCSLNPNPNGGSMLSVKAKSQNLEIVRNLLKMTLWKRSGGWIPGFCFLGLFIFYHILPYVIICYQILALVGRDSCLTHFIILDYLE